MHKNGVGLLLPKSSKKSLLEWKPVSERIITARFKTNVRYVTVIQCYAPTEIAKGELKDAFYTELNGVLRQINSRDIKILMGDLNAKVGSENEGLEHIMGVHGMGIRNVNGELLIDTCAQHDLVIGGTLFPHRNCHKITWVSPDHVTENQIDHIVISRKFRHSLLDVRNRRGADVGSDHHLVLAEFRLKIVANRTKLNHRCKKIEVARLKDQQIKETFALELQNRFQVLSEENFMEEGIETCWQKIENCYLDVGEKILGFKAHQRKEWISDAMWNEISHRKELKLKLNFCKTKAQKSEAHKEYMEAKKKVKTLLRRDKRKWIDEQAKLAEEAARQGNMKDLYNITKRLSMKNFRHEGPVKNKNGVMLTTRQAQLQRWEEPSGNC
ncbi:uncharacterized protein LOC124798156 [Schistocerca piceifrons]|uniref:uncharacterized protein LOC124798156 n=1 Tax=Schistocerca piceifrons TaxID=274613 RepID=UPI001F5F9B77|nr:uncharacterized protein LOC124798156 [Schistocerca piceifrons]